MSIRLMWLPSQRHRLSMSLARATIPIRRLRRDDKHKYTRHSCLPLIVEADTNVFNNQSINNEDKTINNTTDPAALDDLGTRDNCW